MENGARSQRRPLFVPERIPPWRTSKQQRRRQSRQSEYSGLKGRLNEKNLKELLGSVESDSKVFLCGPPEMMKKVKKTLRKNGFANKQIVTENFIL